jgi:hypothetical protein
MASKPAPAEQTHSLADEGRSQQPQEVTPANAPAVVQPINQSSLSLLADEVAGEVADELSGNPGQLEPAAGDVAGYATGDVSDEKFVIPELLEPTEGKKRGRPRKTE